jgi:hypothetical protein
MVVFQHSNLVDQAIHKLRTSYFQLAGETSPMARERHQ